MLHSPAYALVRGVAALTHVGGIPGTTRLLRRLATGYAALPMNRARVRRAQSSIRWCFPEWDDQRVEATAVESYRHLFSLAAELTWTPRFITADGFPFHVELGPLAHGLTELLRAGPSVLITGHCGNWELLGYTLAMLGFPIHAVYRPLDMKPLDDWMHRTRSGAGLTLVDKFGAAEEFDGIMRAGYPLGFIADQNAGDRGLFVPFFNRLASSYKAIALLALRHNAPVICGHARRLRPAPGSGLGPFRYRIEIVDVIRPDDWATQPDPAFYITARYRRAIETMVRSAPEQYLWMHRAWKSRPPHERSDPQASGPATTRQFPARLREKLEQLPWMTPGDLDRIIAQSRRDAEELAATGSTRLR